MKTTFESKTRSRSFFFAPFAGLVSALITTLVISQEAPADPGGDEEKTVPKSAVPKSAVPPEVAVVGRMLHQLDHEDWILRTEALDYLSRHRVAESLPRIREIARDEKETAWTRGRAIVAASRLAPEAMLEEVRGLAKSEDAGLRAAVAESAETLDRVATRDLLATLSNDADISVSLRALASLAQHGGADAWSTVDGKTKSLDLSALPAPALSSAARALAGVGTDEAFGRLKGWIEKGASRDSISSALLRGLRGARSPALVLPLLQVLSELQPRDRRFGTILSLLQEQERPSTIEVLRAELETGDAKAIRTVAVVVHRLLRLPELGDPLRKALDGVTDDATIQAGLIALGEAELDPDRHIEIFRKFLENANPKVRALSIRCLAHCKRANLFEALESRISDEEPRVVLAALDVLLAAPFQAPEGKLVPYLKPALQTENNRVRSQAFKLLGEAGSEKDFAPAMKLLGDRLRSTDEARRQAAAKALGELADEKGLENLARRQGYVAHWRVIGTFLNDKENKGFNTPFPPETTIDFKATYKAKYLWTLEGQREEIEREIFWRKAPVDQSDGKLILPQFLPPPGTMSVAYMVADFRPGQIGDAFLSIDGDDSFRVWLNGKKLTEKVAEYKHRQDCIAQEVGLNVELKAGANRLLIKTTNIDHNWWVRVRFTDANGLPIEVYPQ